MFTDGLLTHGHISTQARLARESSAPSLTSWTRSEWSSPQVHKLSALRNPGFKSGRVFFELVQNIFKKDRGFKGKTAMFGGG